MTNRNFLEEVRKAKENAYVEYTLNIAGVELDVYVREPHYSDVYSMMRTMGVQPQELSEEEAIESAMENMEEMVPAMFKMIQYCVLYKDTKENVFPDVEAVDAAYGGMSSMENYNDLARLIMSFGSGEVVDVVSEVADKALEDPLVEN